MGDLYKDVYSAAQNCINTSFCLDGGSFDSTNISFPRSLKIRVVANPDFWGFGTLADNTLIEGWGTFNEGYFDFFDGHDPDHSSLKTCDNTTTGPYTNEQRPDVSYRSVYDPEKGDKHYANGVEDGIVRGGAESYLLDRGGNTGDGASCDTTPPTNVFKTNPAGYGIAPKILFDNNIYKNITGAWRINECSGCYTQLSGGNDLRNLDCSGAPKQHIQGDENFAELYDPFRNRCVSDKYYNSDVGESGCNSDGEIAGQYAGTISSIVRDTGISPFLKYTFQYDGGAASGIFNGKTIGITATSGDGGALTFFDVQHGAGSTTAYVVGSSGADNYSNLDSGNWTLFNSYDPNTCCGGAAYSVDPELMNLTNSPVYHIDIGRVFNNPKNKIYSNRIDRTYNGLTVEPEVPKGTIHTDKKYIAVNEDGNAILVESGAIYEVDISCQTDVWSATGDYIYKLDGQYSTESGIGAEALATDSGFFPLNAKTLPYYGPFDVTDRFDYTERSNEYGNRQTNRNATCYTKQGSLSVYPDCLTQYTQYTTCDPKTKYTLNNVPRIALVYRGCDFNDPCSFDDSGRPWTAGASGHPSGMEDLIRGFGGQEIQMYLNLGTARAAEIKRDPCCCLPPPCPGTSPPEFVQVPSPVTFPCFPKFDLRPSGYGCQDPQYFLHIMSKLGLDTDPSRLCGDPYYNACTPVQPYTTYGYIRNLCGKETNSRRGVIDSLSEKLHTGDYDDLNYTDNTVEPMYVSFEQDDPDCCSPSGWPTGSEECYEDLLDFTTYGEGASGELVIDGTGGFTFNVTSSGSGYNFGGGVYTTSGTVFPNQTYELTFSGGKLASISSTPGTGIPFNTTIPLTIVAGGSGVAGSGGFSYNACNSQENVHYWGLTDTQGRLALPYFRTQPATATICGKNAGSYIDYNEISTLASGWPKDAVPFLIEIDHQDNCTSCETTQMPTGNLVLTVESLKPEFVHGVASETNDSPYGIYGWNHCKYPGISITPQYNAVTDSWDRDFCESGDNLALQYGAPYTDTTCDCADGFSTIMVPRVLKGTNTPIGYISSGSLSNDGEINSYSRFGNCSLAGWASESKLYVRGSCEQDSDLMANHTVYMKASLSCSDPYSSYWTAGYGEYYTGGSNPLESIYGCNGGCSTSFPAPNNSPNLDLDFYYVNSSMTEVFESLSDKAIYNNPDFLKNGLTFTPTVDDRWGSAGNFTCGGSTISVTGIVYGMGGAGGDCEEIYSTSPDNREDYLTHIYCINGNTGKYTASVNLTPCVGSRVVLYAPSLWKKGVYNRYHGNSNIKFAGLGEGGRTRYPQAESEVPGVDINGCQTPSVVSTGVSFNDRCFASNSGNYIDDFAAAYLAASGGNLALLAAFRHQGCSVSLPDPNRCCYTFDKEDGDILQLDCYPTALMGCNRGLFEYSDIIFDVTYSELTHPVTSVKTTGWYGDLLFPVVTPGNEDNRYELLWWSGENIPGIGNIGPLPYGVPIAYRYDDQEISTLNPNINAFNSISVENACNYHTGPNRYAYIGAELMEPFRPNGINVDLGVANQLVPITCEAGKQFGSTAGTNSYYSSCGIPVPFDTYSGGIGSGVRVNKKACWPEVMTVHKIECESSGYKLHVSREYFEHDRTWYQVVADLNVVPRLGLIDGGETSARYSCEETYAPTCADPGIGVSPTNLDLYFTLKMMTPSDSVTPVYPSVCATGTEFYSKINSSYSTYRFGSHTTSEEHPNGCLYYPSISGQQFWNFYNLLYDLGVPSSIYVSDAGGGAYQIPPDPEADCNEAFPHNLAILAGNLNPVFSSEAEMIHAHSCHQDFWECGGDLWCNKEFFPRKSYKKNTRITRFAALSICEQNAKFEAAGWYEGHETTWNDSPNKTILSTGPFIDACDNDSAVLLREDVGIDDNILYIPFLNQGGTSPSIETLMGIIHPGFKSNINEKTCIYADSGECLSYLPEHNDESIRDIIFTSDEYGYYLDKLVSSGVDNCLFTPFKIMVDVECCPDRIGHRGTTDPTNLNYIAQIPAGTCNGWVADPPCDCNDYNTCNDVNTFYQNYGARLTGLGCLAGIELLPISSGGPCALECVSGTGELAAGVESGNLFQYSIDDSTYWLVDVTGANPGSLLSIAAMPNQAWISSVYSEDGGPCSGYCEVYDTGYLPVTTYNYACTGSFCDPGLPTASSGTTIFSYNGNLYTSPSYNEATMSFEPAYMDVFEYSGSYYRFPITADYTGFEDEVNCCGVYLDTDLGAGNIGKGLLSDQLTNHGGCSCNWTICDHLVNGMIPVSNGIYSFPDTGILDVFGNETGVPIGTENELLNNFGCIHFASLRQCFYPSVVKFNITESI